MQMRTDQRFVGEHAPRRQVDDWLENHPEALVAKRLVERPRRGGIGIGRVHEKQSSRRSSSGPIRCRAHEPPGRRRWTRAWTDLTMALLDSIAKKYGIEAPLPRAKLLAIGS